MDMPDLLMAVLDSIPDPVMVMDVEYRIVAMNQAARANLGDVDLQDGTACCHEVSQHRSTPCGASTGDCPLDQVVKTGSVVQRTRVHTNPDGAPIMAELYAAPIKDGEGNVTHVVEIRRDRPTASVDEAALRESEKRFRSLTESTSDWIWQVDANGEYTYVSPRSVEMLGYEPQEFIGRTAFDFMRPEEANRVREIFEGFAAEKKPFERVENVCLHKDGREVVMETSGVPILDS
ncbi:MAG: PAS domain S-box protein, partial [Myxococcota bacterium]|nr:PAS domain S-box protein [Myxococcota bacterium]